MSDKFAFGMENLQEAIIVMNHSNVWISKAVKITRGFRMSNFHWHRQYEILLIYEGHYRMMSNRCIVENDRPVIFINKPYTLHLQDTSKSSVYRREVLYIADENVRSFMPDEDDFRSISMIYAYPDSEELDELSGYVLQIRRHHSDNITTALLSSLIIHRAMQIASSGRGEIVSNTFSYIQDALAYIVNNLAEPCTIEAMAERYNVGRSKFQADFKATTGMPYRQYLIALRQTVAREMLTRGEGIIRAALECGYSSESHFVKAFREYWGVTPGEYIKNVNCRT